MKNKLSNPLHSNIDKIKYYIPGVPISLCRDEALFKTIKLSINQNKIKSTFTNNPPSNTEILNS